jgi:two-component system, OmpR family, phosphate regulon sensor histidine kinase PhoR
MNTPLTIAVIGVACLAVLVLLVRLRQAAEARERLAEENYQLRQQAARTAAERDAAQLARDALFDVSADPTVIIDAQRRAIAANAAARELSVFQIGQSLIESTRSFELDMLAEETLAGKLELPREFMLNGRLFRARASQMDGSAVIVLRDISELTRLGRARRDFVANIGHELRTPLTAIRLLLDTARASAARNPHTAPPAMLRMLDQIDDQASVLTQMTQELSDLAQIESGQMPMRMIRAPLHEVVAATLARMAPQAERANLTIGAEVAPELNALVDPDQIQRVLSNLVHNAIKFTHVGGVNVFAQAEGEDWIKVGVRDTGDGIASDELPRIFERFYKVDRARGQSGTGLGLAIAKHIVEAHGGRIWVESTLGKGATFYFTVARA